MFENIFQNIRTKTLGAGGFDKDARDQSTLTEGMASVTNSGGLASSMVVSDANDLFRREGLIENQLSWFP